MIWPDFILILNHRFISYTYSCLHNKTSIGEWLMIITNEKLVSLGSYKWPSFVLTRDVASFQAKNRPRRSQSSLWWVRRLPVIFCRHKRTLEGTGWPIWRTTSTTGRTSRSSARRNLLAQRPSRTRAHPESTALVGRLARPRNRISPTGTRRRRAARVCRSGSRPRPRRRRPHQLKLWY